MSTINKKGYVISIPYWIGNLGNHLIQLSGALNVAKNTESRLVIPKHNLINRREFDFTNPRNENCSERIEGEFFRKTECFQYPIEYDYERRRLFQDHIYELLAGMTVWEHFQRLIGKTPSDNIGPDTLVINMRSGGDIFRTEPPPHTEYMQPPLSFYKRIIESNNYSDFLIVTEAARKNPCVAALLRWNRRIRIKTHIDVKDDIRTLLSARHLVTCHSTFSWCLALMSKQLRTLHQPGTYTIRSIHDFSIYTYEFTNYIRVGEWKCSPEQLDLMLSHSVDDVRMVYQPRPINGERSELERSCCAC
jgi:hypothetical protein